MRKVELNMSEQYKYDIIKDLVENNGNKKRAALKLKCTMRTINRLIIKYKNEGESGFLHGNRGKRPARAFDQKTKEEIIDLYITKFGDANYKHFCEILKDDRDIIISDTTLNNWLRDEYILSPKARRKTKKTMKKIIKDKLDVTESKRVRNQLKESMAIIDSKEAHPTRPRSKFMGEMKQNGRFIISMGER